MKPTEGIVIKSTCEDGIGEGRAYDIASGQQLFCFKIEGTTANVINFVSICYAIYLDRCTGDIYSNNHTALVWLKNKYAKTNHKMRGIKWCMEFIEKLKIESDAENIWINDGEVSVKKWESSDWGKIKDVFK